MQAHPHPHGRPVRPVKPGQGLLRRQAAAHRIGRGLEHDKETVTLGAHLTAMPRSDRGAYQSALGRQRLAVTLAQPVQQRR